MKNFVLCFVCFAVGVAAALSLACFLCQSKLREPSPAPALFQESPERVIRGYGYIRGRSRTSLYNKYGSYVKKVYYYSNTKVKKGDCILEYDDFDLRKKITSLENDIANTKSELAIQETQLKLKKLDPLPSDYRNISWKTKKARELLDKAENEWRAYAKLYKSKSVSELDLRSKKQAYQDALASYQISVSDQEKVKCGLSKLYIQSAEENVAKLKIKLKGLERDLAILNEERQYYRIVTPYDGIIKTNSDTVHAWDNPGTAAAVIHQVKRGFYIYSYFEEKDIIHIKDGTIGRFYCTDTGKWYDIKSFEVSRSRTATGDKVFHLVKFVVTSQVHQDLRQKGKGFRVDATGIVEIKI